MKLNTSIIKEIKYNKGMIFLLILYHLKNKTAVCSNKKEGTP
ncbi:MAG: hypothetical protein ACR2F1_04315 [Nitrososphaeraceae archaeon]